jgi:hypothetical protein
MTTDPFHIPGLQRSKHLPSMRGFLRDGEKADGSHLDDVDREVLHRAMEIVLRTEPSRAEQLDWEGRKLSGGWFEAATFASFVCQTQALRLKPWESPPCNGSERDPKSMALLRRMLKAGLSQWEPDPAAALKAAKATR